VIYSNNNASLSASQGRRGLVKLITKTIYEFGVLVRHLPEELSAHDSHVRKTVCTRASLPELRTFHVL
jgi:hypothetical protein